MNNLILVRHGQSLWNKERKFTGFMDIELTENGKSEARHAGRLIKKLNIEFDAYFTSELKRAINSLSIILEVLDKPDVEINKAWELNERHYGDLTGKNKDEIITKYGNKQVNIWRRSYDTRPPPLDKQHPYRDKIKSSILCESLKDTFLRTIPYYEQKIKPLISSKRNVLIVFHGNSCRALIKKIFNISNEKIIDFEIPTGNPLLIRFGESLEIAESKYLDKKRTKKIFFNV